MSRRKTNCIWRYFDENVDLGNASCKICKAILKNNRNFNLKQHMINIHNYNRNQLSEGNIINNNLSSKTKTKSIKIEISKKELFRAYVGLVTEDSIPFNTLNSPNMKSIINPICKGLQQSLGKKFTLNAANCKNTLKLVAGNVRASITKEAKDRLLCLKIDSASRLSKNIFGISLQFIDDAQIKSRILGMTELKGINSSTSINLATEILKVLNKYNISLSQIISVTSDNGANMLKASKILSYCTNFEDECEKDDDEDKNDNYIKKINDFEKSATIFLGDIQICRCAAHTVQLCALDVLKNSEIKNYVLQCRNLTKFLRKSSNGYREVLEIRNLKVPQLDCPTRWGSTYGMLEDIKNSRSYLENLESVEDKSADENFILNESLWNFIESYCKIFNPLQKTIINFQEEQLHYGNFYAQWLKCELCIKKILESEESQNSLLHQMGDKILQSMETRASTLLSNEGFNACLFMDPRFQHIISSSKKNRAIEYLKLLWDKFKRNNKNENSSNDDIFLNCFDTTPSNETVTDEEEDLLNTYLMEQNVSNTINEPTDVHTKIERLRLPFVKSNIDVLRFWLDKKIMEPELYILSTIVFSIPPTQVTIERAFSSLKLILADNRNRLTSGTLENVMLVKLNSAFLDDAINNLSLFEETEYEEDNIM